MDLRGLVADPRHRRHGAPLSVAVQLVGGFVVEAPVLLVVGGDAAVDGGVEPGGEHADVVGGVDVAVGDRGLRAFPGEIEQNQLPVPQRHHLADGVHGGDRGTDVGELGVGVGEGAPEEVVVEVGHQLRLSRHQGCTLVLELGEVGFRPHSTGDAVEVAHPLRMLGEDVGLLLFGQGVPPRGVVERRRSRRGRPGREATLARPGEVGVAQAGEDAVVDLVVDRPHHHRGDVGVHVGRGRHRLLDLVADLGERPSPVGVVRRGQHGARRQVVPDGTVVGDDELVAGGVERGLGDQPTQRLDAVAGLVQGGAHRRDLGDEAPDPLVEPATGGSRRLGGPPLPQQGAVGGLQLVPQSLQACRASHEAVGGGLEVGRRPRLDLPVGAHTRSSGWVRPSSPAAPASVPPS